MRSSRQGLAGMSMWDLSAREWTRRLACVCPLVSPGGWRLVSGLQLAGARPAVVAAADACISFQLSRSVWTRLAGMLSESPPLYSAVSI
jgi:hypothetical protein